MTGETTRAMGRDLITGRALFAFREYSIGKS